MVDPQREDELQRYLDGESPLSARYRAQSRETVPPELDAAVLDYARAQARRPRARWRRFSLPLAAAAMLVLAVNLVWLQRDRAVPEIPVMQEASRVDGVSPAPPPAAVAQRTLEPAPARHAEAERRERAAQSVARRDDAATEPAAVPSQRLLQQAAEPASRAGAADTPSRKSQASPQAADAPDEQTQAAPMAALAPFSADAELTGAAGPPEREARNLAALLRAGDLDLLRTRYDAAILPDAVLDAAAEVLRTLPSDAVPRLRQHDEVWTIDYADADGSVRCSAQLQRVDGRWRLLALDARW